MGGAERRRPGSERRRRASEVVAGAAPLATVDGGPVGRLAVKKTWKLFVGGAFVRSESGRYLVTEDGADNFPRASRKDLRDAVKAALDASKGWAGRTAHHRGQILYRLGEVMEARRAELVDVLARGGAREPGRETDAAIDRAVIYAGWTDKYQSLLASSNPVAGPHFGFSVPEPVGVVGVAAPGRPSLLGLVGSVCPVIASGNVAVVIASEPDPRTALALAECFATSDLPPGVVNLLTGSKEELLPHLARHVGIRALDLWNLGGEEAAPLERAAAENVKRVSRRALDEEGWYDEASCASPRWIDRFVETKTVWHPMGA